MNRKAKIISLSTTIIGPTIEDYIFEDMRRNYEERLRGGAGKRPCIYGGLGAYLTECVYEKLQQDLIAGVGFEHAPQGILSGARAALPDRDTRQRRRAEARKFSGKRLI